MNGDGAPAANGLYRLWELVEIAKTSGSLPPIKADRLQRRVFETMATLDLEPGDIDELVIDLMEMPLPEVR